MTTEWTYFTIGVWVTGEGEQKFMPAFLRELSGTGRCSVVVQQRIGQLTARGQKRKLKMVGKGQHVSTRQEDIALRIRGFLQASDLNLALLVDDLEKRSVAEAYTIYREPIDRVTPDENMRKRASVNFLVPMVEAYFLADAEAVKQSIGVTVPALGQDPETVSGPKGKLKTYCKEASVDYNEKEHGEKLAGAIDLQKVLGESDHCKSLRTLMKWCLSRIGEPITDRFQLSSGELCPETAGQI